jgi:hypothetical protein
MFENRVPHLSGDYAALCGGYFRKGSRPGARHRPFDKIPSPLSATARRCSWRLQPLATARRRLAVIKTFPVSHSIEAGPVTASPPFHLLSFLFKRRASPRIPLQPANSTLFKSMPSHAMPVHPPRIQPSKSRIEGFPTSCSTTNAVLHRRLSRSHQSALPSSKWRSFRF